MASAGNSANSLTLFSGLAEDVYDIGFLQNASSNASSSNMKCGIGYNSTSAASGTAGTAFGAVSSATLLMEASAKYWAPPALGINVITSLEQTPAAASITFNGTEANMLLFAEWRA